MSQNTQLTSAFSYNVKNMIFEKPKDGNIPGSSVSFKRIPIKTKNPDGTWGDLVIETPRLYSFGLQVNLNMQTQKPDDHSLSLCLYSKNGATNEELKWVEKFYEIVEHCKKYLLENKDAIGKYDLDAGELKKFGIPYQKKEKGKIVEGSGPILYPKVSYKKNFGKKTNDKSVLKSIENIDTIFFNEKGKDVDPLAILGKHCYVRASIQIDNIFVGAKIALQIKIHEAQVELVGGPPKRLLSRPVVQDSDSKDDETNDFSQTNDNDNDDTGSIHDSQEEKEHTTLKKMDEPVEDDPVEEPIEEHQVVETTVKTKRRVVAKKGK